ncbi:hypothetical protein KSP40_PGU014421 [Platanthera guangdongensis]|uniref:Uncharacterized protein n=1 Tax=Platanthera guangdongensis TaxID=2320717 RepID=A0ABR2LDW6_9ASPA
MKEAILCCISCILPCGALDVVRIVHTNGRVEEIAGNAVLFAGDIMGAYPKHVLRNLPSHVSSPDDHDCSIASAAAAATIRAVTLPPTAELKRGKIYFLMPVSAEKSAAPPRRRRRREQGEGGKERRFVSSVECLSEKVVAQTTGRRGRVAGWRPGLESISEQSTDL